MYKMNLESTILVGGDGIFTYDWLEYNTLMPFITDGSTWICVEHYYLYVLNLGKVNDEILSNFREEYTIDTASYLKYGTEHDSELLEYIYKLAFNQNFKYKSELLSIECDVILYYGSSLFRSFYTLYDNDDIDFFDIIEKVLNNLYKYVHKIDE